MIYKGSNIFNLLVIGEEITQNKENDIQVKAVMDKLGIEGSIEELPCGCDKITRDQMDQVLKMYMGISLDDTNKIGLESFVYLSEYDAYYHIQGDTNYRMNITFSKGKRDGDIVQLYYKDEFLCDGDKLLTLKVKDGGYKFVSNQRL